MGEPSSVVRFPQEKRDQAVRAHRLAFGMPAHPETEEDYRNPSRPLPPPPNTGKGEGV